MDERRTLSGLDESAPRLLALCAESGGDPAIDELSRKMVAWSGLWFGSSEACELSDEHRRVRERLLYWLKRCIGCEASQVVTNYVEDISLATSTPFLTAFLGRRAMLEFSRRVLNDL